MEYLLINETPNTWNVVNPQGTTIGRITQQGTQFRCKGSYFEVVLSEFEYAKSVFIQETLVKSNTEQSKQLLIPIA